MSMKNANQVSFFILTSHLPNTFIWLFDQPKVKSQPKIIYQTPPSNLMPLCPISKSFPKFAEKRYIQPTSKTHFQWQIPYFESFYYNKRHTQVTCIRGGSTNSTRKHGLTERMSKWQHTNTMCQMKTITKNNGQKLITHSLLSILNTLSSK